MGNKVFIVVVLLLWGSTMTWLISAKIVPHFFDGEPPSADLASSERPTAWKIALNGKPCGVAITQAVPGALGSTEIHSLLRVKSIPLPEVAPQWMQGLLSRFGEVSLDMRTRTALDSFGSLATFETRIRINDTPELIGMTGVVQRDRLQLRLRSGDFVKRVEYPWQKDSMLAGELMPAARLTNLHVGKKWRAKVYNPFGPPSMPVNMIEAEVVALHEMQHQGELMPMHHIEYRLAPSAGVSLADRVRSEVWVAEDGRVLRHKVAFLNAQLVFERVGQQEADRLADSMLELDRYATIAIPKTRDRTDGAEQAADD